MKYTEPKMTIKTFSSSVHTAAETSAVMLAEQYLRNNTQVQIKEIKIMTK